MKNVKVTVKRNSRKRLVEVPENNLWELEENKNRYSGFMAFKRRIDEQLQLMDADVSVDDDDLLPYYRMGESETFVLGALGCL